MTEIVSILIPTFNNPNYLRPCINSIIGNKSSENLFHIYVINNGHPESCNYIKSPDVTVINAKENLGWVGGLKLGLKQSKEEYVMFLNDDTYILPSHLYWLNRLLEHLKVNWVGAVGPSSNVVMGWQNIFAEPVTSTLSVKYLIGFCLLTRRKTLEEVGGLDDTLPGGDDLDLSIRLRDKGYSLIGDRTVFVYHHGFKTGERIFGTPDKTGGWNSYEFTEKVDFALIQKHGFRKWFECIRGGYEVPNVFENMEDIEGDLIRKQIKGKVVLDLGCGATKTIPEAIGLDMVKKGEKIDSLTNSISVADIVWDVSKPLPFPANYADTIIARHILEHMIDPFEVIGQWLDRLKPSGRLILALPDQEKFHTIPVSVEHLHAFTKTSIKNLLEAFGLKVLQQEDGQNNISFITVAEKV